MWEILVKYREGFSAGLYVTVQLTAIIWILGLTLGPILGWSGHRLPRSWGRLLAIGGYVLASIPVIVLLFWAHYPLQAIVGAVIDPFITAAAVLALVNVMAVADIVRNALKLFPAEYLTAAKVCGMKRWQVFRSITFPLLLRQTTPALLTSQVTMLQATLFASMISVEELLRVSQRINATAYRPVEIYTALALIFLAVCLPLNLAAELLKRRFIRDFSEK